MADEDEAYVSDDDGSFYEDDEEDASGSDEELTESDDDAPGEDGGESALVQVIDHLALKHEMATAVKTTRPVLTKFERTRVMGVRVRMLLMGAVPLVDTAGLTDEVQIAERELEQRTMPLIVRRQLGPGKFEYWRMEEFVSV
jgi:DNA-directed RNA polymerase I, II, and III subunit RPABC2